MSRISVLLNTCLIDGKAVTGDATGIYVFGGYKKNDVNNDGYLDSANFDELEAYGVSKVVTDVELGTFHYELKKLSGEDVADFIPDMTTPTTTDSSGGTSPELLAIEKERAEREKEILQIEKDRRVEEAKAHKDLHSEEKVVRTDVMGNEEEQIEGYYPAVRAHKYLESHETQWGLNQVEILRHQYKADKFAETVASAGVDPFASLKFNAEVEFATIIEKVDTKLKDFTYNFEISPLAWKKYKGE